MVEEVRKIFVDMVVPEELNRTHITLIPKIPGPETLSNYRPISLCNMVYKIVSKIVVARLRPFLARAFLPANLLLSLGEGERIMLSSFKNSSTQLVERRGGLGLWR